METDLDDTFLNTNDNTIVISSSQSDNSDTNIGQSEKENTIAEQIDDQNTNIGQNLIDADIDKIGDASDLLSSPSPKITKYLFSNPSTFTTLSLHFKYAFEEIP